MSIKEELENELNKWVTEKQRLKTEENSAREAPIYHLADLFGIADKELFYEKYMQSVAGDGQNEQDFERFQDGKKGLLKSSSLYALLHFYRNKVVLKNETIEKFTSDTTVFEFKNPVVTTPSNMDVVLFNRSKVIFLESKYTESFDFDRFTDSYFPKSSKTIATLLNGNSISVIDFILNELKIKEDTETRFHQFIKHYIGVIRRILECPYINNQLGLAEKEEDSSTKTSEIQINYRISKGRKVYLGYVIADINKHFPNKEDKKGILNNYTELAKSLNEITQNLKDDAVLKTKYPDRVGLLNNFTVLDKPLLYSEIKEWNQDTIEKPILEYYGSSYAAPKK